MNRSEFKAYMKSLSWKEFLDKQKNEQSYYGVNLKSFLLLGDLCLIGLYLRHKRLCEYFLSKDNLVLKLVMGGNYLLMRWLARINHFQIPLFLCEWGLRIPHYGTITMNGNASVGKNLWIYPGSNIGEVRPGEDPIIGDNCYIGLNAVISGKVIVGDNAMILPNAVVTKNVPANTIVGGVPAKAIRIKQTNQ